MKPSSKLVFFGTEDFSLPSLRALVEAGFDVALVVTKPDSARGRSKQLVEPAVKTYAREHNIRTLQPDKLSDITDELVAVGADAAVLVAYGKLLPGRTLDVFEPSGVVNVHPSLLPQYRGPAPVEAAIENGDTATGISLIKLTLGMDEGAVFAVKPYPLTGTETKPELSKQLAEASAQFLVAQLPDILTSTLLPIPQKTDGVSYTTLLSKQDSRIDPLTDDAATLERRIRAHLGYPKSRVIIGNNDVIVTMAKVVNTKDEYPLTLVCRDNTYLALLQVTAPSGKTMTGEAYVRGYAA